VTAAAIVAPTPEAIAHAAQLLGDGRLVAMPTETVYGLAADATDDGAVAALYAAKGRPAANPLIVHVATAEAARALGVFDTRADRLARAFWPGPLTLVLRRTPPCAAVRRASAGLDTIAIRVPADPVALALLKAFGKPVVAPSANRSGEVSPTAAAHVAASLGERVALILDGGPCPVGVESTVISLAGSAPLLLRPGGIARTAIEAVIGPVATLADVPGSEAARTSPGLLGRHYAPHLPVRLDATRVGPDEALLAFGPRPLRGGAALRNLSATGDLAEAARNLFAMLRELDSPAYRGIAVMSIPATGIGAAINDRLKRAAAGGALPPPER
jgi:L-threonylcarbamoyladenylate synthase